MVSCLNRHYLPLNPAHYGWKKEDNVWVPVWFEGDVLPNVEEPNSTSHESLNSDNHDDMDENESKIEDSEDEESALSGDELQGNSSDID